MSSVMPRKKVIGGSTAKKLVRAERVEEKRRKSQDNLPPDPGLPPRENIPPAPSGGDRKVDRSPSGRRPAR
jgi:hypothetical protein